MKYFLPAFFLLIYHPARAQSYFQQRVDTRIDVRLDDKKHFLHGFESFTYVNHSPDTLRYIYLHLFPNAYSSDRTYFSEKMAVNRNTTFYFSKPSERGYMDSLDITVDDQKVTPFSKPDYPDIARIDLPKPLLPGDSMHVATPFRVKIPIVFSRMGHTGQAYYISQWFPKPAVYDRKGWHPLPYSDQGEFFSEIGSYDVSVTLPKNYIVMATGNCAEASENAFLDSLSQAPIPTFKRPGRPSAKWRDSVNRFPKSATEMKTLHFHEDNIHDFAWFADKRWIVRKDSIRAIGNPDFITAYAGFLPSEKEYWLKATRWMKYTVQYYSQKVGAYPYKTVKVIEGDVKAGGGMEYPTVAEVDKLATYNNVMETIVHEVGHNWFYGLLATNERDDAWMDEGTNTFYEQKVEARIHGDELLLTGLNKTFAHVEDVIYYHGVAGHTDQPLNRTSSDYTRLNYGIDVYYKSAIMLNYLQDYIGIDDFDAGMHAYYNQWHFRHPYPEDMEAALQAHTTKPVHWWFKDILATTDRIDFSVHRLHRNGADSARITLRNRGDFAAPVRLDAYSGNNIRDSFWTLPFVGDTTFIRPDTGVTKWSISNEVPDENGLNNEYRTNGIFHRWGVRVRPGFGLGVLHKSELYVLPAIGYNNYDGFMAGLLLHDLSLPDNKFKYAFAPMYGFRSKSFVGAGSAGYFMYPKGAIHSIGLQVDVKTYDDNATSQNIDHTMFARFTKVAPSLTFTFKRPTPTTPLTRTLTLKGYSVWEDSIQYRYDRTDSLYIPSGIVTHHKFYGLLNYSYDNRRTFNPFSYTLEGQLGADFAKLSAEGKIRIDYNLRGKSLYIRGFAGKFIPINNDPNVTDRYDLTATYTGANDYLYDGTYFGRNEQTGFASHQVSIQEGGLKIPILQYAIPLGLSDDWLASLNIKTDLPLGRIPLRLFLDVCSYSDAANINPSGSKFLYDGGAEIHLLYDMILVHFPFVVSQDYHDYLKSIYGKNTVLHSISFTINLQNFNWLKLSNTAVKLYN